MVEQIASLSGLSLLLVEIILMLLVGFLLVSFMAVMAGILSYVERRVAGRIQSRIGPNRVGPQGLLQWIADGVKLILKEDITPEGADLFMFRLAPLLCVAGVFGTFVVLPWGANLIPADLNVGLLYLISITSLVVIGILMAGWSSNSKWALLGGMRSAAQIVSYEIPVAMGLLPAILMAGSLSMNDLMSAQSWGPWGWLVFQSPFTLLAFFVFFAGSLAESNRVPFDLPEAESELVAGFFTEYSGFRFAVFTMAEFANVWVMGVMTTAIFLGGGNLPAPLQGFAFLSVLVFMAKVLFVIFLVMWLRWTLPRFRIDQMMEFSWKYLLPLAFLAFFGQSLWALVAINNPMISMGMGVIVLLGCLGVVFKFIGRVKINQAEQATPVNSRAS